MHTYAPIHVHMRTHLCGRQPPGVQQRQAVMQSSRNASGTRSISESSVYKICVETSGPAHTHAHAASASHWCTVAPFPAPALPTCAAA